MKRFNSIWNNSKIWTLIKDMMDTINSGKKTAQDVYRLNNAQSMRSNNTRTNYTSLIAQSHSIR